MTQACPSKLHPSRRSAPSAGGAARRCPSGAIVDSGNEVLAVHFSELKSSELGLKYKKIAQPGLGSHGEQGRAMTRGRRTVSSPFLCRGLLALSLAALMGAGCATTPRSRSLAPANTTPSPTVTHVNDALVAAALQTPSASADYRLGAEDLLEITL